MSYPNNFIRSVGLENIRPDGEWLKRTELNLKRLDEPDYSFEYASIQTPQAPGDYIGRAILGQVMLWRALKRKPKNLDELVGRLPEVLNSQGYMGKAMDWDIIKELVIAGHNAFLRGLCEYYSLTGNKKVLGVINTVIENLVVPFCNEIKNYPNINPNVILEGQQVALVWGRFGKWELSTDIGTIYLALDGITHAYQLIPSSKLKEIIERVIGKYYETDLLKINAHIHSSLSALIGILRFYETTGCNEQKYLQLVERIFDLYKTNAMTENYANYNWFERPEWTEPCAVVDSFILAVWLWKLTQKTKYLHDAHYILYNALWRGQRGNGGFGCDTCVGNGDQMHLRVIHNLYEAKYCCTMRGAEGLVKAIEYNYFLRCNEIIIPFMASNVVNLNFYDGNIILKQTSGYPYETGMKIETIFSSSVSNKSIKVFIPNWIIKESINIYSTKKTIGYRFENDFLVLDTKLDTGDIIIVDFKLMFRKLKAHNHKIANKYIRYFYGPIVLGYESLEKIRLQDSIEFEAIGGGLFEDKKRGIVLRPANNLIGLSKEEAMRHSIQVLFTD